MKESIFFRCLGNTQNAQGSSSCGTERPGIADSNLSPPTHNLLLLYSHFQRMVVVHSKYIIIWIFLILVHCGTATAFLPLLSTTTTTTVVVVGVSRRRHAQQQRWDRPPILLPTTLLQQSNHNDNDESKNEMVEPSQEVVQRPPDDELSNFLWKLEEEQQNRSNPLNVLSGSSSSSSSDLPIPFFTSILILLGSLYVTGYGIYIGIYGFPPEGDTSFASSLPRIF